jgi:fluoride exporter
VAEPHVLPTDPDVDLHDPQQRQELRRSHGFVVAAVAAGGALGALARYGVATAIPAAPTGFPWATLVINVTGCLLIGVLMVLVTEVFPGHHLLRPFLGTGVLGGFTTFSTYVVDTQRLVDGGRAALGLFYLAGTLVAALAAVWVGSALASSVLRRLRRRDDARVEVPVR